MKWLRKDLAAHHTHVHAGLLAHPGVQLRARTAHDMSESAHMLDVWQLLYEFGADVVVNGHDHDYERFAPQDPGGKPDPKGIREFVVGTGGGGLYQFKRPAEQRGPQQPVATA